MTMKRDDDGRRLRSAFTLALSFAVLLWAIELADWALGLDLVRHGIYPRRLSALDGIVWAPLIHGTWSHLFANTGPILVLGTALLYGYPRSAKWVLPTVYIGSGLGVWLFARASHHIGASGLTFGVMFFVLTIGILRWDRLAIALAMLVIFLYGGTLWGILPSGRGVSFESHLFGALVGVALAFALKHHDPPPPEKRYSWEDEDQQEST